MTLICTNTCLGCIFAELVSGRPLLPGKTNIDQLHLTLQLLGCLTPRQEKLMLSNAKVKDVAVPSPEEVETLDQR